MNTQRRNVTAVVSPILLGAAVIGIMVLRREEELQVPANLPENIPEQEELATWAGRRGLTTRGEQAIVALRTAKLRGLRTEEYAYGLGEADPVKKDAAIGANLKRLAADLRNGRRNPGLYKGAEEKDLNTLIDEIATDPQGVEAALDKLDPPFAEYARLKEALAKYRQIPGEEAHVKQIERTMDRWRWLPREFPNGVIVVNVPEYRLRAYGPDLIPSLDMKVVVGALKHPTPLFMGNLQYVVFGPFWHVPESIQMRELVPDVEKDRTYLARNRYEVTTAAGEVVGVGDEASDEILEGLKSGEFKLRQVPGAKNALGRVKFMFPNQNNVYLHDTNAPKLFAKDVRTFSHGCIRVEHPEALANWVLRGETGWTKDRIEAALAKTKEQQANVHKPIPVLIVYHTVTVGEDGEVRFLPDVYGLER